MKSPFAKGCLGVLLLLILGGGFIFWRFKTPPKVGENFKALSPQQKQTRRKDAKKLEEEAADVVRRVKRGDTTPFRLVASEQQLNTLFQDKLRTEKFAIRDLRVGLKPHELSLQGTVPYKGFNATLTLTGDVIAENGKIIFKANDLLIGGLARAPDKWKKKIEKQVTKQLGKLLDNADVKVTNASVENGSLILEGAKQ
jgi:hypothetical protein